MSRLRVAVVGLDHYHVTGWVETIRLFPDELKIVALQDADPSRGQALAPRFTDPSLPAALPAGFAGLPFETDLDRLIERHQPDIALVTLANRDAPSAIERMAGAGIHLIVDKPAALTAADARRAFDAVRRNHVRAVVGLTRRYSPAWREARRLIADGALGRLVTAEAVFAAASVPVRDPANHLFSAELSGGGILAWLGIHDLDAVPWLVGEPVVEVSAITGRLAHEGLEVEDVATVALRFAGGAVATLHQSYSLPARGYRTHHAIRGLDASVELGPGEELTVLRPGGPEGGLREAHQSFDVPDVPGYGASGYEAVADLLGAIREGRETDANGEVLVAAVELVEAAYESAREGRVVRLPAAQRPTPGIRP
jgi:predicted dehydrogenase